MNEEEIEIVASPGIIRYFGHLHCTVLFVVVVPELAGDENVLPLHQSLLDRPLHALAAFLLIAIVIGAIEETVASFDGLIEASVSSRSCVDVEL